MHPGLNISQRDLKIERAQCLDEGKDIAAFEGKFAALDVPEVETDAKHQARAGKLLDRTQRLHPRKDSPFKEPCDLAGIRRTRTPGPDAAPPGG